MSIIPTNHFMGILQYSNTKMINKVGYLSIDLFHECLVYDKFPRNSYNYKYYNFNSFLCKNDFKQLVAEYFDKFTSTKEYHVSKTDFSDTIERLRYIENKIKTNEFNFKNKEIIIKNYYKFLDFICYTIFDLISTKNINNLIKCKYLVDYLVELVKNPLFYINYDNSLNYKIQCSIRSYVFILHIMNVIKRYASIKIPNCILPKTSLNQSLDYIFNLWNSDIYKPINYSNIFIRNQTSNGFMYASNYDRFINQLRNLQKYNNYFLRNFYLCDLKNILLNNSYQDKFDKKSISTFNNTSLNLYIINMYNYLYEVIDKYGLDWDIINKYADMLLERFCGPDYKVMVVMIDSVLSTMGKNDMEFNYSDYLVDFLINVGQKVKVDDIIQSNIFSIDEYKSLRVLSNGDFGNCYMFMRKRISEQFGNLSEAYNILEQNKFKTTKHIWE